MKEFVITLVADGSLTEIQKSIKDAAEFMELHASDIKAYFQQKPREAFRVNVNESVTAYIKQFPL